MLLFIISLPFFVGIFICTFQIKVNYIKSIALNTSLLVLWLTLFIFFSFDNFTIDFQIVQSISWFIFFNTHFCFGLDNISLLFILLTSFFIPLCFLSVWKTPKKYSRFFYGLFLILESFVFCAFLSLDLFIFYVFFEAVLIPMFLVVGVLGSRKRKIRANFIFFIYTFAGSLLILFGILIIYIDTGCTNYLILIDIDFSIDRQKILWICFFLSFIIKTPIFPFHLWLPETHVEAPTVGSVILAAVLLKLGTFGIMKFNLVLFFSASVYFKPFVYIISCVGVIFASLTAIRQSDVKRVIAYSSVAHINLVVLGLFSFQWLGFIGSVFQQISHGIVSGALFFCIGVIYDKYHTRIIKYFGGLVITIPIFVFFFLSFTLGNMSFPGTSSFVGEFLVLISIFNDNKFICVFSALSVVLCGVYSLLAFNQISFSNFNNLFLKWSNDVNFIELQIFSVLFISILFIGVYPNLVLIKLSNTFINFYIVLIIMKKINFYINGQPAYVNCPITIFQYCNKTKIEIPRFCVHEKLIVSGNCRICLVEVFKVPKPVVSCSTFLSDNIMIFTHTPIVKRAQESVLEFLLISHPLDCPICDQAGECDLQNQSIIVGNHSSRFFFKKKSFLFFNLNFIIKGIITRCINCTRCTRFLSDYVNSQQISLLGRGNSSEINFYKNDFVKNSLSGNIIDLCPVSIFTRKIYIQ